MSDKQAGGPGGSSGGGPTGGRGGGGPPAPAGGGPPGGDRPRRRRRRRRGGRGAGAGPADQGPGPTVARSGPDLSDLDAGWDLDDAPEAPPEPSPPPMSTVTAARPRRPERGRDRPAPAAAPRPVRPPEPEPEPEPLAPEALVFLRARAEDPDEPDFADWEFAAGALHSVAAVRFIEGGRIVLVDVGDMTVRRGELVVCDVDRVLLMATVVTPSRRRFGRPPSMRVARRAHEGDQRGEAERRRLEQIATRRCAARIRDMDVPAKLVRTEMPPGGGRLVCYLASEEKLDLRELARDLTRDLGADLSARLEIRQIGVRDSTKVIGGVGPCGLQLCCNTFLQDFAPVSIRHAKDQALVLNPAKISGVCGRLMCCLVYEEAYYRAHRKLLPKIGKRVRTPEGEGRVRDVDVLKQTARIEIADASGIRIIEVRATEIQPVSGGAPGEADEPADPADEHRS